jgi:hypothetical protein
VGQIMRRQARLFIVALMVFLGAAFASVIEAQADPVRTQCAAEAKSRLTSYLAKTTPEQRESTRAAGIALGLLVGGVFMAAREASTTQEDINRSLVRRWEKECLAAKGLEPLPATAPLATAPSTKGKSDGRTRQASTGSSGNTTQCACKEMTTCHGSWVTMSCNQLKDLCRGATTKPIVWTRNGCEKLQTLVGGF